MSLPLASVLTPTFNRPAFLRNAVEIFLAYRYPAKEMIIVDDSPKPAIDLPPSPLVKYIWLDRRVVLGEKHNITARAAQGEFFVHQDDDDFFGPRRLEMQLEKIALGEADLSGFPVQFVLDAPTGKFFRFRAGIAFNLNGQPDDPLLFRFHDSSSAYHRRVYDSGLHYLPIEAGEKATFLNQAIERGFRQVVVPNREQFCYVRHGKNTWQYRDWLVHAPAPRPWWFPEEALEVYRRAA